MDPTTSDSSVLAFSILYTPSALLPLPSTPYNSIRSFADPSITHSEIQIVSVSQALMITNQLDPTSNSSNNNDNDESQTEVFKKFRNHCKRFATFTQKGGRTMDAVVAETDNLQEILSDYTFIPSTSSSSSSVYPNIPDNLPTALHPFEVSQLMNLMTLNSQYDEILCLIPSLERFVKDEVEKVMEIVRKSLERVAS